MVITVPALSHAESRGPRPLDPRRDIPAVINLLQLVFGQRLDPRNQRLFTGGEGTPLLLPSSGFFSGPQSVPGFVWEEDGHILGNVSLLSTRSRGRYLVANVAVHPSHRRRGIARVLMETAMEMVGATGGQVMLLQVRKENQAAVELYRSLGFRQIGNVTRWHSSVSRLRPVLDPAAYEAAPVVRPLPGRRWQDAYSFDLACVHPDLNWPEPIRADAYRHKLRRQISNFLNGRTVETWMTNDAAGLLTGLVRIKGKWGAPYKIRLRVADDGRGALERPLLMKCIRRLQQRSPRNVRLDYPEPDDVAEEALTLAGFAPQRTLTHMRYTY